MVMIINKKTSRKALEKFLRTRGKNKAFNAKKHYGAIRFKEDAVLLQRRLRNEWK
jgi:hypothetical protein